MANWYVRSAAAGAGTGADWTNAYTTLGAAATAKAAGDVFYVADDHAETAGAAKTITFAGTEAAPNRVYCVNRAGSVPPVAADLRTTGQITTTGAFGITLAGTLSDCYGIIFNCGTGATAASLLLCNTAARVQKFSNCQFALPTTAVASRIQPNNGGIGCMTFWENCTVNFGNASQAIALGNSTLLSWRNTANAVLGTAPTVLFIMSATSNSRTFVEGVDLSAVASGKTLVNAGNLTNAGHVIRFKDCKLGAAVGVTTLPPLAMGGTEVTLIRSDSGDTNYRTEKYNYFGSQTTETTIVRTGGATDGVTTISVKIVTLATTDKQKPYECLPIVIWNDRIGSPITVTLQGIWGGGAVPNNDDIWMEAAYLGTSGFPLGSSVSCGRATPLTAGSALPAGTGTWGGSTTKFALACTLTPQEKGPITLYVRAALASTTFYVDPQPALS
jgi:hypothetical protein